MYVSLHSNLHQDDYHDHDTGATCSVDIEIHIPLLYSKQSVSSQLLVSHQTVGALNTSSCSNNKSRYPLVMLMTDDFDKMKVNI